MLGAHESWCSSIPLCVECTEIGSSVLYATLAARTTSERRPVLPLDFRYSCGYGGEGAGAVAVRREESSRAGRRRVSESRFCNLCVFMDVILSILQTVCAACTVVSPIFSRNKI